MGHCNLQRHPTNSAELLRSNLSQTQTLFIRPNSDTGKSVQAAEDDVRDPTHIADDGGADDLPAQQLDETNPFSFEYPSSPSAVFENTPSPAEILNSCLEMEQPDEH